jgi:hypothetical protein
MTYIDRSPEEEMFLAWWRSLTQGLPHDEAMLLLEQAALSIKNDNTRLNAIAERNHNENLQLRQERSELKLLVEILRIKIRDQGESLDRLSAPEPKRSPVLPNIPQLHQEWRSGD